MAQQKPFHYKNIVFPHALIEAFWLEINVRDMTTEHIGLREMEFY